MNQILYMPKVHLIYLDIPCKMPIKCSSYDLLGIAWTQLDSLTCQRERSVFIKLICFHKVAADNALVRLSISQADRLTGGRAGTSNAVAWRRPTIQKLINEKCLQRVDLILIRAIRKKKELTTTKNSRNNQKITKLKSIRVGNLIKALSC